MKSFHTLRGFVEGSEDQSFEPYLACSAALRISSESELDFDQISTMLAVQPSLKWRRGERAGAKSPRSKRDVWMYQPSVAEHEELRRHVDALWSILKPNVHFLLELKSKATVEISLGYCTNIDHGGIVLPAASLEMFTVLDVPFGLSIVVG